MIAIIFEVRPAEGQREAYFDHAKALREELAAIDGFISVERFQSLTDPGKLLSISFFRDEAAVLRWRTHSRHRSAQSAGRAGIFAEYRIRVAEVLRDYAMHERRDQVPSDSHDAHGG